MIGSKRLLWKFTISLIPSDAGFWNPNCQSFGWSAKAACVMKILQNINKITNIKPTIREVIPDVSFQQAPAAPEKPKRGTLQTERAKERLGFYPSRSIDVAYKEYCEWYMDQWHGLP